MNQPIMAAPEYGRETTPLTDDEVAFLKAFVQRVHRVLMPLSGPLTGAIVQSLSTTEAMTMADPFKFVEAVAQNARETLPKALRDTAAGQA